MKYLRERDSLWRKIKINDILNVTQFPSRPICLPKTSKIFKSRQQTLPHFAEQPSVWISNQIVREFILFFQLGENNWSISCYNLTTFLETRLGFSSSLIRLWSNICENDWLVNSSIRMCNLTPTWKLLKQEGKQISFPA